MKLSAEEARQLYRESRRSGLSATFCPDAERLQSAAEGRLPPAEKRQVAEHLGRCSDCSDRYLTLARRPGIRRDHGGSSRRSRWWPLAATLLLAVGAAWWLRPAFLPPAGDPVRGRSPAVVAVDPRDGAVLAEPPARLSWREVGEPGRYRVLLFDAAGTLRWESAGLESPEAVLPDSLRRELALGGEYRWQFVTERGTELQPSPLFRLEIAAQRQSP